jgi:hypothetical protein
VILKQERDLKLSSRKALEPTVLIEPVWQSVLERDTDVAILPWLSARFIMQPIDDSGPMITPGRENLREQMLLI